MLCQLEPEEEIPKRLEKEAINELPIIRFKGPVHLANDLESCKKLVQTLRNEKVLGFDIECKPNFKKGPNNPPALLQLSTSEQAYLFRLHPIMKLDVLIEILENPTIVKTGVALKDDLNNLQKIQAFQPSGFEDIAKIAQTLKIEQTGLRNLTAIFFKHRLSKSAQLSNWEKQPLSPAQINYAATDAWISRQLYMIMKERLDLEN
jgi:ribonuclease D